MRLNVNLCLIFNGAKIITVFRGQILNHSFSSCVGQLRCLLSELSGNVYPDVLKFGIFNRKRIGARCCLEMA